MTEPYRAPEILEESKVGYRGVEFQHYEKQGIHFLIGRHKEQDSDAGRYASSAFVCFANHGEQRVIGQFGERAREWRHLAEHVEMRLQEILFADSSAQRRLEQCIPELHQSGVKINAHTYSEYMVFDLQLPWLQPFHKSIEFIRNVLTADARNHRNVLQPVFDQEKKRIAPEIVGTISKKSLNNFIARHICTAGSFSANAGVPATPENTNSMSLGDVESILLDMKNSPVVVAIENPPDELSDEQIVNSVTEDLTALRNPLRPLKEVFHDDLLFERGWVHLEHPAARGFGNIEATCAIPIRDFSERDMYVWRYLNMLLYEQPYSPLVLSLQHNHDLGIYASNAVSSDVKENVMIVANVDVSELSVYLRKVAEFFTDGDKYLEQYITAVDPETGYTLFETKKMEILNQLPHEQSSPLLLAQNLMETGHYTSRKEEKERIASVTVEEVLDLHRRIKEGVDKLSLFTVTAPGQAYVVEQLRKQFEMIESIAPLQRTAIFSSKNETVMNREQTLNAFQSNNTKK